MEWEWNYVLNKLIWSGVSVLFLAIAFRPLELAFPAKKGQRFFRPDWFTDLCFFLGQYLLFHALVFYILYEFSGWLHGYIPPEIPKAVVTQPFWLQAIEVVVLSDIMIYWAHRLQHRVGILWRFHAIHHSSEHLDWLAAHREHPIDSIYTIGIINLPYFLLGFPVETIGGLFAFRGIWAIYIHSNVRLNIGPLRKLIGSPELHHWHHDKDRDAGNYANISPLMDVIFGTYVCPDHEPESFGIHEPSGKNYLAHMIFPFLPKRLAKRFAKRSKSVPEVERGKAS